MCMQLASIDDKADFKTVNEAIKQIGFTQKANTFWKIVAAVLHLVSQSPTVLTYDWCWRLSGGDAT